MNVHKFIRRIVMAASLALPLFLLPSAQAHAAPVIIQVGIAPPVLPVYFQPYCPGDGYIWTPGYWAYGDDGYYWVPGTWVLAPEPGFLWTPAYWGWEGGFYVFHGGYWGPHVGFYGGINYGFGYGGVGFEGGEWRGGHFFYNSAVVRFGGGFHPTNVYVHNVTVINHTTVAYNGGPGGLNARPTPQEQQAMHENHVQPTSEQVSHQNFAAQNRSQLASVNHGHPAVPAAATPASFHANPTNAAAAARPGSERAATPGTAARQGTPAAPTNRVQPMPANHEPTPGNASRPATPAAPASHSQPAPAPRQQAPRPAPAQHSAPAPSHSAPSSDHKH